MNDNFADLGEKFLLDNYDTCRLETEYDMDGERIFIQLTEMKNGKCTVLDGSDIFRQVHELAIKMPATTQQKLYRLSLNENDFTGTAEDVARWYCKQEGIKLFIEPDNNNPDECLVLYALFPEADTLTLIVYLEDGNTDIETAYRLFFSEYMLEIDNPDFAVADV